MKLINKIIIITFLPVILFSQDYKAYYKKESGRIFNSNKIINTALFPISDNQKNYDVKYYRIELDIDTSNKSFAGIVNISAKVVNNPIDNIELDFTTKGTFDSSLITNSVDSVIINNSKTNYSHKDSSLTINLIRRYNINENVNITVYYHSKADGYYFMIWKKNEVSIPLENTVIWTLNEPFGARFWYPCKDYPEDKADSADIIITVPKGFIVASNGTLKDVKDNNKKQTYFWRESYPIATYLISVTAYPYQIYSNYYKYSPTDSMEIRNYILPGSYNEFSKVFPLVPKMMKFFSDLYGEYPFIREKYAHAEVPWRVGMEHQTCTSIGLWDESVVVHELAHSWFGDMITCKDFNNIWINEGFATYSEELYTEKTYGKEKFLQKIKAAMIDADYPGTVFKYRVDRDANLFSFNLTYQKSSLVVHMLRHVVGDSVFFKILKELCKDTRYKYNVIDTKEFQQFCESVYKKDLGWFFHQWIYEEYNPVYQYRWSKTKDNGMTNIKLSIDQIQTKTNYIFKMPIDISFKSFGWDTTVVVYDSLKTQEFNFALPRDVDSVFLDKNYWILKSNNLMIGINSTETHPAYSLSQNYPNPFNSSTRINFSLKENSWITVKIYDLLGREVMTPAAGNYKAGNHMLNINGNDLSSGIYFYRLTTDHFYDTKKFILMK
jgi:aminopeptidase N